MIDRKKYLDEYGLLVDPLFNRIDELEDALDELSKLGNGKRLGNSIGNDIAHKALISRREIDLED